MASAGCRLYVYYRVAAPDVARAVAAVRALQGELVDPAGGLAAECLRRPEVRDGQVTLMEVYTLPATLDAAAAQALQASIEARATAALGAWLQTPRQVERFQPL